MTTTLRPASTAGRRPNVERRPASPGWPELAMVLVGVACLVAQLLLVPRPFGLSTDEATYLAKADPSAPELWWSAPRAWGVPLLAAPIAVFSPGIDVIRVYFAVLSSGGLVAAFWPWLKVLRPGVAPLAALLFGTTWFTQLFGSQVMPNLYVGLAAVGTVGAFVRAVQAPSWPRTVAAAGVVALLALLRPVDSVLVVAPVVAIALLVPRLRRVPVLAALLAGGVLGWLPWTVEAFLRFGDPWSRLTAAEQAGPKGLHPDPELLAVLPRLLDGIPAYYTRDLGMDPGPVPAVLTAWMVTGLVLVPVGLVAARVQRRSVELAVVVVPAAVLAAFYLVLPAFTALRFLLPVVALLALPVAVALVHGVEAVTAPARPVVAALVAVCVAGHVAIGVVKTHNSLEDHAAGRTVDLDAAAAIRPLVERERCLLVGQRPQVIAFYVGCSVQGVGPEARPPAAVEAALGRGWDVLAVMDAPAPPGSYLVSWRREELPGLPTRIRVFLPPEG